MASKTGLIHYTAGCLTCDASIVARNAMAWAHNHARRHGHAVEVQLGYRVSCDSPDVARPRKDER